MHQLYNILSPITSEYKYTSNRFTIDILEMILFTRVTINVVLYDNNDRVVRGRIFTLEGDDYQKWSNDDQYIVDYVTERLHMILQ